MSSSFFELMFSSMLCALGVLWVISLWVPFFSLCVYIFFVLLPVRNN